MARSSTIPPNGKQQDFAPGDYGPFNLDSFTQNDTTDLRITITNAAGVWPAGGPGNPIMRVTYGFTEVGFNVLTIEQIVPDRHTGLMPTSLSFTMGVPHALDANGVLVKQPITGAQVSVTVFKTVNCVISVAAE